jgi:hypothetical protein
LKWYCRMAALCSVKSPISRFVNSSQRLTIP